MYGHVPDEPEGDWCRCDFPPSSRLAGILPNAQREENSNMTTYTMAESSRDGCSTVQALVDTASKNLDQTILAQITPAQLMRKAATVRNTQVTVSGKTPMELAMGRKPRDLSDPASMNPEQLTCTDSSSSKTTRRHPPRSC